VSASIDVHVHTSPALAQLPDFLVDFAVGRIDGHG
jgi:hypothetical protein